MKKLFNQQGIAALEVAVLIVVLAVLGFVGYRAYTARYTSPKPADVEVEKKTNEKNPPADPYSGWKEFKGTCSGYTLKHPTDWKEKLLDTLGDDSGWCQELTLTSPSGNVAAWMYQAYGDGPGCDMSDVPGGENNCYTIKTLKIKKVPAKGKRVEVYLVDQIVCDDHGMCEGRIGLIDKGYPYDKNNLVVGTQKIEDNLTFETSDKSIGAFYMTQGKTDNIGNPPDVTAKFTEQSAKEWLASSDVATAKLILKSLQ